jgi:chromosome segregation ATPase
MSAEMRDDAHEPATKRDLSAIASALGEIREQLRPIAITLAHHSAELADIRGHIKDKMVTRDEFHSRMDGFAGRVSDFDHSTAKNRARLDDHEKRIIALEEKRA